MAKFSGGRTDFRDWIDKQDDPHWDALPLTHVSKALVARDIIGDGRIRPATDDVFDKPVVYFFYGRPSYRVSGDGSIKVAAACPFCFVFDSTFAGTPTAIHAFDTGAFGNRMYSRILMEEMTLEDFGLGTDYHRANRLVCSVFGSREAYLKGDISAARNVRCPEWEFHLRAYLDLISSPGRNEPDDRVCSIEFLFDREIPIEGGLRAVVAPHVLWDGDDQAPWLLDLGRLGVEISTYEFIPGKNPEYYPALMEFQVAILYKKWGLM